MNHYDDPKKFAADGDVAVAKKKNTLSNNKKALIDEIILDICDQNRFPEHYYRAYLRGHYADSREFIVAICIHHDISQHKILTKYHEYTLQVLERTPDAEVTRMHEENGIRNFREIAYKACVNTVNMMLKAQRNIIRDLDSRNIEVSQKATKMVVKIMGKKMAGYVDKLDESIAASASAEEVPDIDQAGDGGEQEEGPAPAEVIGQGK